MSESAAGTDHYHVRDRYIWGYYCNSWADYILTQANMHDAQCDHSEQYSSGASTDNKLRTIFLARL